MSWLPYTSEDGDTPEQRDALARVRAERGAVSLFARTLAHAPAGLRAYEDFSRYVRTQTRLEPALRELLILRLAILFGNVYEWRRHTRAAAGLAISEERMLALADWRERDLFDERERAALGYVDGFLAPGHRPSATDMEAFTAAFEPDEAIEVALLTGLYATVAAVMVPLGLGEDDTAPESFAPLPAAHPR
jgi:alkylhydroperoxidase family enzyme